MISLIKRKVFLSISFSLIFIVGFSQSFKQTIEFADLQFNAGNYPSAIADYQRAIYFDDGTQLKYLHQKIATSYYKVQRYEDAYLHYSIVAGLCDSANKCNDDIFKMINCKIIEHKFKEALVDVFSLEPQSEAEELKYNFYLATIYFGLEDFDQAVTYFYQSVDKGDSAKVKELQQLFLNNKDLYHPNPKVAKILSIIIPGTGQFYSGDIKAGFNSLILTAGIISLAVVIGSNYGTIDGVFTALPWYQRYFQGGYIKAEQAAVDKRQQKRSNKYKSAINILQR